MAAPVAAATFRTSAGGGAKRSRPKPSAVTGRKPSGVSAPRSAATMSLATTSEPSGVSGVNAPPIPAETTSPYGSGADDPDARAKAVAAAAAAGPAPPARTSNAPRRCSSAPGSATVSGVPPNARVTASRSTGTAVTTSTRTGYSLRVEDGEGRSSESGTVLLVSPS